MTDGPVSELLLHVADLVITLGLLKGTLLAAVAALLAVALRRASAAVRAGVWGTALLVLVALPVLVYVVPWWELGVVAFPQALFDVDAPLRSVTAVLAPVLGAQRGTPPALWVALLWAIGAAALAAHFLWQRLAVEMIARAGEVARDRRTRSCLDALQRALGIRRPIRVVYSADTAGPYTFGVLRATVVLPQGARGWSEAQLRAVLLHELAHVARADYPLLLAAELARILYWPNPAVWLLVGALRRAQDGACDDVVLGGGIPAVAYARHLVAVARQAHAGAGVPRAALPLVHRCELRERIRAVLDGASDRRPVTRRGWRGAGALAISVAVLTASVNFWDCPASGDTPPAGAATRPVALAAAGQSPGSADATTPPGRGGR